MSSSDDPPSESHGGLPQNMKLWRVAYLGSDPTNPSTRVDYEIDWNKPHEWQDLLASAGWGAVRGQMASKSPEAAQLIPTLKTVKELDSVTAESRLSRAERKIAEFLAKFWHQWDAYARYPQDRIYAVDGLKDSLRKTRLLWQEFEIIPAKKR